MLGLPQVAVPYLLYHVVLSGLICVATWHALTVVSLLFKRRKTNGTDGKKAGH